jgi:flagellar motor switch protein FliN/FliY
MDTQEKIIGAIPVVISVEIGRKKLTIDEIKALGRGSVIELDSLAGEQMTVYANGSKIATGEVVVVNDKFGVRLIDIEE